MILSSSAVECFEFGIKGWEIDVPGPYSIRFRKAPVAFHLNRPRQLQVLQRGRGLLATWDPWPWVALQSVFRR